MVLKINWFDAVVILKNNLPVHFEAAGIIAGSFIGITNTDTL